MRRAEKAGRERAAWILDQCQTDPLFNATEVQRWIDLPGPPYEARAELMGVDAFHKEIGAHNLTGRALEAAYAAYDRGYRARLKEELEKLQDQNVYPNNGKCVRCEGRLGAQNPNDTCDTCRTLK